MKVDIDDELGYNRTVFSDLRTPVKFDLRQYNHRYMPANLKTQ